MSWALVAGVGAVPWVAWIDRAAAAAHLRVIRAEVEFAGNELLFADVTEMPLNPLGVTMSNEEYDAWLADRYARQMTRLRTIAEAVRGFALALDENPLALGAYAPARIAGDDGDADYPELYSHFGAWRQWAWGELTRPPSTVATAVAAGQDVLLDLYLPVDFTEAGGVVVRDNPPDPEPGADGFERTGGRLAWWDGLRWKHWQPGAGAASSRVEVAALLPCKLAWEFWRRVGRRCVARGPDGSASDTFVWVGARNLRLAKLLGGMGLPAAVILHAGEAIDVLRVSAHREDEDLMTGVALLTAVGTAIDPAVGIVAGVILGLLVASDAPIARAIDCWGRRQPFLEKFSYTGALTPAHTPPTHEVPAPSRVILAGPGEAGWSPVSGAPEVTDPLSPTREDRPPAGSGSGGSGGGASSGGGSVVGWVAVAWAAKTLLGW